MAKKILQIFLLVIAIALLGFFLFAPAYVDKSSNKVTMAGTATKNDWYDSIPFIADLHCDELLWDRDLLKKIDYGHVDVPRMQQANMAFQVFTIVSKVPAGINIEKNDDNSDQIALLSFAQLRPVSNWFSIKARALNQCQTLHDFAKESNGQLRVITSRQELQQFITDRKTNPKLTSGMLGLEGAQPLEGNLNNLQEFYNVGVRYIG
ncbi:MAG: membrane dipeptidase, partial [Cyclobacteriaceae bacterium]